MLLAEILGRFVFIVSLMVSRSDMAVFKKVRKWEKIENRGVYLFPRYFFKN